MHAAALQPRVLAGLRAAIVPAPGPAHFPVWLLAVSAGFDRGKGWCLFNILIFPDNIILIFFAWLYIFLLTGALGIMLVFGWARFRQETVPAWPVYQLRMLGLGVLTILLGFYSLLAPPDAWQGLAFRGKKL